MHTDLSLQHRAINKILHRKNPVLRRLGPATNNNTMRASDYVWIQGILLEDNLEYAHVVWL